MIDLSRFLIKLNVVLLAIPIVLLKVSGIDAPLSDLTLIFSLPIFIFIAKGKEKTLLAIAIFLSLISIVAVTLFYSKQIQFNAIISFIYFYRPYFIFFVSFLLIKDVETFNLQFSLFSRIFSIVGIAIFLSIILNGGVVRVGGELLGNIFGLPIFGTYGVNSLAVLYVVMLIIIFLSSKSGLEQNRYFKIINIVGIISLLYLIVGSSSREALLGLLVFSWFYFFDYLKSHKVKAFIGFMIFVGFLTFVYFKFQEEIDLTFAFVITRSIDAIQAGQWDDFTSGRISLVSLALQDIARSPIFGTGFYGFDLFNKIDLENSSPHNQYITSVWKMGSFAAIFYFLFLYNIIKRVKPTSERLSHQDYFLLKGVDRLIYVFLIVFCLTWDILMVPNVSMLLMFLIGASAKLNSLNSEYEK